jgi:hypothetical protein
MHEKLNDLPFCGQIVRPINIRQPVLELMQQKACRCHVGLIRLSDGLLGVNGGKLLAQLRFLPGNVVELSFDIFKSNWTLAFFAALRWLTQKAL